MNELSTNPLQLDAADTQRSAGCAPTAGSRFPTREDGPIVDSSWDYDDDESDDDTTDLSDCGMIYDNAFGFECELSGSEQCEFCPNRAAIGRENVKVDAQIPAPQDSKSITD